MTTRTTVSIGYVREDGDFAILATLNNNDGLLTSDAFDSMVGVMRSALQLLAETGISVLERQDAPDYVAIAE